MGEREGDLGFEDVVDARAAGVDCQVQIAHSWMML